MILAYRNAVRTAGDILAEKSNLAPCPNHHEGNSFKDRLEAREWFKQYGPIYRKRRGSPAVKLKATRCHTCGRWVLYEY